MAVCFTVALAAPQFGGLFGNPYGGYGNYGNYGNYGGYNGYNGIGGFPGGGFGGFPGTLAHYNPIVFFGNQQISNYSQKIQSVIHNE